MLSVVEDVSALTLFALALLVPVLVALAVMGVGALVLRWLWRRRELVPRPA